MKRTILILLFFFIFKGYGQAQVSDTSNSFIQRVLTYILSGNTDSAIIIMDKAILNDSSCYNLYLIRGYIKLWDYNNESQKSAIHDFDKYISKKTADNNPCLTNDSLVTQLVEGILNYKPSNELCDFHLPQDANMILNGVILYFKPDKRNTKKHCEYWTELQKLGNSDIIFLVDKYCN